MMAAGILICLVAFLASGLTFFSGFGLGTLLLPAFALFFPIEVSVALTAVVHFLNGLFKLTLVGRNADRGVVLRFGIAAALAAVVGAEVLTWLSDLEPLASYHLFGRLFRVTPVKLALSVLMLFFAAMEAVPRLKRFSVAPKYLPVGGALTGFFGGLSGHQGALRSVFLLRAGLSKEAFIATGTVIATGIDVMRLGVYSHRILAVDLRANAALLISATLAAFTGAFLGNRMLKKITLLTIERVVAALLLVIAVGLGSGVL